MKIKQYKKGDTLSYTIGVFATLELLEYQKGQVKEVVLHSKGEKNEGVQKIREVCEKENIHYTYDDRLIEHLSRSENTYALGVFAVYQVNTLEEQNHLLLVNPSDMGNLGTIIRTALGFGIKNLAIIKPAVDVFDPKVIRASQGAIFQMNFQYFDSFHEYTHEFKNNCYPFMLDGRVSLEDVKFQTPYALTFGNEGAGLDSSYQDVGMSVKIPQSEAIDSLNLAISVGIGLYEAYKQK